MVATNDVLHSEKQEKDKTRFLGLKAFQNWIIGLDI